jgi:tetratricopeptide (TPR) repeat protein
MKKILSILCLVTLLTSCQPKACILEPNISYCPTVKHLKTLPNTFPPLTCDEEKTDWGREMRLGLAFACELDLYRAITCYKRALILYPFCYPQERKLQIQYALVMCYYLGGRYQDVADTFNETKLSDVPDTFPGFRNLLIILYDSYLNIGDNIKAFGVFKLIDQYYPEISDDLALRLAILKADFDKIEELYEENPIEYADVYQWMNLYEEQAKSVKTAQFLNAVLPGAGYLYIGQPQTALTAAVINALFITAAYEFYHHGNTAAGIITTSLELGWYVGGINGAGLAAKAMNEDLYNRTGKSLMLQHCLFPVLMFDKSF